MKAKNISKVSSLDTMLDEVETLKDNFQKISDTLVNWVKKESDVDTCLSV